jgi:hypothetical protein
MPVAIEASTYLYLSGAEPAMTAIASRPAQNRPAITRPDRPSGATFTSRPIMDRGSTSAQENEVPIETLPTQADLGVAQLLRFERLDADWDGNEAAKPLPFSLKEAREFIRALAPESVIPRPALHADGHAILFLREPDTHAELEFLGSGRIGFYARWGGEEWSDEFDFDGHTLPAGLLRIGLVI